VKPDIMVFGKKTQVCGIAISERVNEVDSCFVVPSRISSTFEGNLVDMVRCQRVIEIIEEDDLLANAVMIGEYLQKLLNDMPEVIPEVSNVRGRGLWAAFDLPSQEDRDKVIKACFEEYLIVLPCGEKTIRMRPSLDVKADAIGRGIAQLEAGICRAYGRQRPQ
jgi:L-lysine 6-transaminase